MHREDITSIEFKKASFSTQSGVPVFSDISIELPMNEIIWLKGSSGSGKSVLIKMICGLLVPNSGELAINKKQIYDLSFEEFTPLRCNMGYSFDFGGLINNRNILANLLLPNEYHNYEYGTPNELVLRVTKYLELFNLSKVAYERPSSIVGGLRKAACVARAFIHDPELLLLDDPTTGLRGETRNNLKNLIQQKKSGGKLKHVIVASEDNEFMEDLATVTIEINDGTIRIEKKARAA